MARLAGAVTWTWETFGNAVSESPPEQPRDDSAIKCGLAHIHGDLSDHACREQPLLTCANIYYFRTIIFYIIIIAG